MCVTVIDYGLGNLYSVTRALEHCGATVELSGEPEAIRTAEQIVLPGVGAFADGMRGLEERGLVRPLIDYAHSGRPLLGICLGMQMLASVSEEFGEHAGLGLIAGRVVPVCSRSSNGEPLKVPHIGWVPLRRPDGRVWAVSPLSDTEVGSAVYLVHSFHLVPDSPEDLLAYCEYGGNRVTAAVGRGKTWGFQFHPEKSGPAGLQMLRSFLSMRD